MTYRIEYADGRRCNFINSSKALTNWLKSLNDEGKAIADIRKQYKSGVSDSVMDIYKNYIHQAN